MFPWMRIAEPQDVRISTVRKLSWSCGFCCLPLDFWVGADWIGAAPGIIGTNPAGTSDCSSSSRYLRFLPPVVLMLGYSVAFQIVLLTDVLLFAFPVDRGNLFSCHHKILIFLQK